MGGLIDPESRRRGLRTPPCPAAFKNVYSASGGPASSRKLLALLIAAVLALLACQAHAQAQASQSISSQKGDIVVTELLTGLDHPWSIAFLPDDSGEIGRAHV